LSNECIGSWSDAEFVRALHRGIGRNGQELYPAFPHPSYALMTTDDALVIRTTCSAWSRRSQSRRKAGPSSRSANAT
jgi:hypothetical protein